MRGRQANKESGDQETGFGWRTGMHRLKFGPEAMQIIPLPGGLPVEQMGLMERLHQDMRGRLANKESGYQDTGFGWRTGMQRLNLGQPGMQRKPLPGELRVC